VLIVLQKDDDAIVAGGLQAGSGVRVKTGRFHLESSRYEVPPRCGFAVEAQAATMCYKFSLVVNFIAHSSWGTFQIGVRVFLTDGQVHQLKHQLRFR
jgi:hypothetical protein